MILFFENHGVQVTATPEGGLNLKGLSGLTDETRQEVLTFARENKASILSELAGFLKVQEGPRLGFSPKLGKSVDPDTCRACGENAWWRKNEPNSKWFCGRCHPPATGLDVIYPLDKRPKNTPKKRRIGNDTN